MDYFTQNADGLRAAIEFKLWAFKYRHFDDYQVKYYAEFMPFIKANLLPVYMATSRAIALQLRPAIVAIAGRDFPATWPDLVKNIVAYLSTHTLLSLKLLRKLTAKYEISARSDPLYEEIIEVCNTVHDPLLQLTAILLQKPLLKELKSAIRLFYYLNYQDLHPSFEDNVRAWMELLGNTLRGSDFRCKGEAMKAVFLYTVKYKDDFSELIIQFSNEIWQVCTTTTEDAECDKMVLNALKYFKALMNWPEIKQNLELNLKNLVQSLIVKNVQLQSTISSSPSPLRTRRGQLRGGHQPVHRDLLREQRHRHQEGPVQ